MKVIDNELLKRLAGPGAYQCGLTTKKQLTAAIPFRRHYYRYNQAQQYFGLEAIDDNVQPLLEQLTSAKTLELLDPILERIDKALETVDDAGGFRLFVLEVLADLHIRTARRGLTLLST